MPTFKNPKDPKPRVRWLICTLTLGLHHPLHAMAKQRETLSLESSLCWGYACSSTITCKVWSSVGSAGGFPRNQTPTHQQWLPHAEVPQPCARAVLKRGAEAPQEHIARENAPKGQMAHSAAFCANGSSGNQTMSAIDGPAFHAHLPPSHSRHAGSVQRDTLMQRHALHHQGPSSSFVWKPLMNPKKGKKGNLDPTTVARMQIIVQFGPARHGAILRLPKWCNNMSPPRISTIRQANLLFLHVAPWTMFMPNL